MSDQRELEGGGGISVSTGPKLSGLTGLTCWWGSSDVMLRLTERDTRWLISELQARLPKQQQPSADSGRCADDPDSLSDADFFIFGGKSKR